MIIPDVNHSSFRNYETDFSLNLWNVLEVINLLKNKSLSDKLIL